MKGSKKSYAAAKELAAKIVDAPWNKKGPAGKSKKLTATQKASAKAKAAAAGRPYPNLVDNMNAAKRRKK